MIKKYIKFLDKMAKKLSPKTLKHTLLFGLLTAAIVTIPVFLTTSVMAIAGMAINPLTSLTVGGITGIVFAGAKAYGDSKTFVEKEETMQEKFVLQNDEKFLNNFQKSKSYIKNSDKLQQQQQQQPKEDGESFQL